MCMGKLSVYKHCFCYLKVQKVNQKDLKFYQSVALSLHIIKYSVCDVTISLLCYSTYMLQVKMKIRFK